jgi:hypothetical protein
MSYINNQLNDAAVLLHSDADQVFNENSQVSLSRQRKAAPERGRIFFIHHQQKLFFVPFVTD